MHFFQSILTNEPLIIAETFNYVRTVGKCFTNAACRMTLPNPHVWFCVDVWNGDDTIGANPLWNVCVCVECIFFSDVIASHIDTD